MNRIIFSFIVSFLATATFVVADHSSVSEVFVQKIAVMLDADPQKSQAAMRDWENFCFKVAAPGREADKTETIRLMKGVLGDPNARGSHFWMLHQLSRIGDESCAETVAPFLDSGDRMVRDEALFVLGNLPGKSADRLLSERIDKESDATKKAALEKIRRYREGRPAISVPTIEEAFRALENADPDAADFVLPKFDTSVTVQISGVDDCANRFSRLRPQAKVLLLDMLTKLRDRTAIPLALASLDEKDEAVRLAGIRMLGPLGDKSALSRLLVLLKEGGKIADTAGDSIARLNFDGADRSIVGCYEKEGSPEIRKRLLDALSRRRGTIGTPVFQTALDSENDALRRAAIGALRQNDDGDSIVPLTRRFFEEKNKEIRNELSQTLFAMILSARERDKVEKMFFDEYEKRMAEEQSGLLFVLGKIGGNRARGIILERIGNPSDIPAFNALCDWPDASVAAELLKIASDKGDPRSARAVRAYLRIITLPANRNGKESVELFKKGFEVAATDEDKIFLLSRLGNFRNLDVFDYIASFLDHPDLAAAARRSVLDQCNDFWFHMNNRTKIDPALDRIIATSQDNGQVDRARQFKSRRAR